MWFEENRSKDFELHVPVKKKRVVGPIPQKRFVAGHFNSIFVTTMADDLAPINEEKPAKGGEEVLSGLMKQARKARRFRPTSTKDVRFII